MNNITLRPYDGNRDVAAWLKMAGLVAKLTGVKDVMSYIALNLENDLLPIYLESQASEQADAGKGNERSQEAFDESPFESFNRLERMRWDGEQVRSFCQ